MAEGQRLRWWQEQEEPGQTSRRASERVTLSATPLLPEIIAAPVAQPGTLAEEYHDTWEDLEAEAVRRAEQAKIEEAESVSFFMDKSTALLRHRREGRQLGWGIGGVVVLFTGLYLTMYLTNPHHHHSPPPFGAIGGFASFFSLYYRRRKWLEDREKPTLRLSPQGLFINSPAHQDVALPWEEIVEIKPKGSAKRRYLEIRASKRRRYLLEGRDLPVSADAIATRIAIYETGRVKQ